MHLDLDMGRYAGFVWGAWGITALVLGALVADTLRRAKRWSDALKAREDGE